MAATEKEATPAGAPSLVDELSEDLDVAIREFLERNPETSRRRIRQAIRAMEQRERGGPFRRLHPALALLAVFTVGVTLGLMLG
jgi:ribosomal 50S subunit-associated protein YjgA (DUF615 family)